jgi:hypothetical protein
MKKDPYVLFYVLGRATPYEGDDFDESEAGGDGLQSKLLGQAVGGTSTVRDLSFAAAKAAIDREMTSAVKREWMTDNAAEIIPAGGDGLKAYRQFTQGRIDALSMQLEDSLAEELLEELNEEDDDDDDDEDDEDDEDEDDAG